MLDIYSKINNEIADFFKDKVHIAGVNKESGRYLSKKSTNYEFSQSEMINIIDLYYNSKFESGLLDSEGQRKLFLNICKFRSDVASKQIDIDIKDFLFYPEDRDSEWAAYFLSKEFKQYAKESYFSELINDCVEAFPKYGWVVLKIVQGKLEFVPLQTIRNQQDAKSLNDSSFVTIEHPKMSLREIKSMKGWNLDGFDRDDETYNVYERYGYMSLKELKEIQGEPVKEGDEEEYVDTLVICTTEENEKKGDYRGHTFFAEKIKKRPFIEAHWSRQYGRLMGIGEIENQLENQVGMNMVFNLYRRQLLWSSKKVFQSIDDSIANNLVTKVKDGEVIKIGPNGQISQVDMSNKAGTDFSKFGEILEKNSDQKSFTYDVATGESTPSGTPFRLGVLLANSVNSHFGLKREKLGLMLKNAVMDYLVPEFKKKNSKEHIVSVHSSEEGFELLRGITSSIMMRDAIKNALLNGKTIEPEAVKQGIEGLLQDTRLLFFRLQEGFYEQVKYGVGLTITGEEIDIPKKIETLTNLYTTMVQAGDPRAERILKKVVSYTGENFDLLAGPAPKPQAQQINPQQPQATSLSLPTGQPQNI